MKKNGFICMLAVFALFSMSGMLFGMSPEEVMLKTGIAGGLCSFPRSCPADDALALKLAKQTTFVVHCMARNSADATRLRDSAEAGGVLGRSLYVESGAAKSLPFADRLADIVIVTDLCDEDLTAELKTEWLRVLAPRRGAALVGHDKAAAGKLSQQKLEAWIKNIPRANIISDNSGLWAILRTELPAGSDTWTHRCHGPDNSQTSNDTALKAPFLTQWWGMPREEGFWGTTVVAGNGRCFTLRGSRISSNLVFLTARSITSGIVLWKKEARQTLSNEVMHGGYIPGRSCIVVSGDTLFLIDRDSVLRLDGETGKELDRIAGPKPGGGIKWIASSGDTLAMLAGEADKIHQGSFQALSSNSNGRVLSVYDTKLKKELWRDIVVGDIDERLIATRDDRLYCVVQNVGLFCRDLRAGKILWTNTDADLLAEYHTPALQAVGHLHCSQTALLALNETLILRAKWAKNLFSISRTDGRLLWKRPASEGSSRALTGLPFGGLWLDKGKGVIDLKTGAPAKGPTFISSDCGPTTCTPEYLITCFAKALDIKSDKIIRLADLKGPCDIGSLVSEGALLTVPSECGCNFELKGYRALVSAGNIRLHSAPAWKNRLITFNATEPSAIVTNDADWLTYRHDPQRSGSSSATASDAPKILWSWKPAGATPYDAIWPANSGPRLSPDFLATAPIAAGGFVWFASHDGIVRCLKADSGKEIWKFPTSAMIFASPTLWQGRLLIGGGDGRIYCLNATTGSALWQLMAAPMDRRIFWFGHLVNTWPVIPGVVVKDNIAYTVAGYQKGNGIHAYALNPKNGQVLWEKDDAGANPESGLGNGGNVALADGKFWLASQPAGYFNLASGEWKSQHSYLFGCEVGVFGKWMIHGGRRLSETQDTLSAAMGVSHIEAIACEGERQSAPIKLTGDQKLDASFGASLPAWDNELVIMPPKGTSGALTAIPTAKMFSWLATSGGQWNDLKMWTTEAMLPTAWILLKNQLIVTSTAVKKPPFRDWYYEDHSHLNAPANDKKHKLIGYRRSDGSKAWSVDLPDQPVMNRLSADRDGRILVSLCDGSIICVGQ